MSFSAPALFLGPAALSGSSESVRDRAITPTQVAASPRRALLIGTTDPHVSSLLTDVLRDIQLDVRLPIYDAGVLHTDDGQLPHVVLAMVDRVDGVRAITEARARFPKAPVVAILTLGTHRLGTRAVAAGAAACYLLDQPIDRLRGLISALLSAPAPAATKAPASRR